jgi:VWFA-related protein
MKRTSAIFLWLSLPALAAGQNPPAGGPPPVSESVTVAVTDVEVVVTDSKGRRVPGLAKNDFEVLEDGIPQPITNFYAVSGGRTTLADGAEISLSNPEQKPTEEVPSSLKAKYIIYIDNVNIEPLHRTRIFKSLIAFLEKTIGPNAEGMVITFNRSLKVRQRFTSEKGVLIGVLETIEGEAATGNTIVSNRRDAQQQIFNAQTEGDALNIARNAATEQDHDIQISVDALKSTVTGFAGVEGRKYLIYVSDGLPQIVGEELFELVQRKYGSPAAAMESLTHDRSAGYASVVQAANSQGVTIFALDASGLRSDEGISPENQNLEARSSSFALRQNFQAPLELMSEETGGFAAINTNDATDELGEIAKDFSDFYSLGYRSTRGAVDRPHRIEVRVKKSGLRVRHRSGYMEKTVETRTAEAVTAALYYSRTDNPLKFSIGVGKPKSYQGDTYLVPVKISIPLEGVTLVPEGDDYNGRLYIYFVVLDASQHQSDLQIRPINIKVASKQYESAKKKAYGYDVQLIMIPGGQKLSVAVRDSVSGDVSYAQKSVFVSVLPEATTEKKAEPGKN